MGILYKVKKSSLVAVVLIAMITLFTQAYCTLVLDSYFAKMLKFADILLAIVTAIVVLAIVYYVFSLILSKESGDYQQILIVNIAVTFVIGGVLSVIAMLSSSAQTNIWISLVISIIQFGLLGWINWTSLEISRKAKINISIWTLILFVISLF